MADQVQCNMCDKLYDDLEIQQCEECHTDAYLYNVSGSQYNSNLTKETLMINFDNVINEEAIAKLTDEQAEALLAILEKAGY